MARAYLVDEIAAVREICTRLGLGNVTPTLLMAAHHTTLLIAPLGMVARVQSSLPLDIARDRAVLELSVARHLAVRGAPILAPLAGHLAGPHATASAIVTLWPYVEHERTATEADASLAAGTLAAVHNALSDYASALPSFTRTLDRCWRALTEGLPSEGLSASDRVLLRTRYRQLREEIEGATTRSVPLHGDAHLGNLLLGAQGPLWTDFEDACVGPRELDIACLPSSAWPDFRDADQTLVARCAALKSVCVAIWCWADPSRSPAVREAAEYHMGQVRRSVA